jgi:hypothetical protein
MQVSNFPHQSCLLTYHLLEKTSNATKRLREAHDINSPKTLAEIETKAARELEVERLRRSKILEENPKRLRILLETLRIVNNNLPFSSMESAEARLLNDIAISEPMKAIITSRKVRHTIVEMYAGVKVRKD